MMKFIKKHWIKIVLIILFIITYIEACFIWELNYKIKKIEKNKINEIKIELIPSNEQNNDILEI